jgi:tRNA (cytidine/uridine-2'-O-)-methyltransferase
VAALTLALYQPDIAQNAGAILRTCACFGVAAAIIEPAGFPTSDRHFRRAGMDYLDRLTIVRHNCFEDFEAWRKAAGRRLVLATTAGDETASRFAFRADDVVLVGRESAGAPAHVHAAADARVRVPIRAGLRSMNVAASAAVIIFEALRQTGELPP